MLNPQTAGLVGTIYQGVTDPDARTAALRMLLEISDARCVFVGVIDSAQTNLPQTGVVGPETSRLDEAMRIHRDEMVPIDPGLPYALDHPRGGNFRLADTDPVLTDAPDTWREFVRRDFGSGDYHSRFSADVDGLQLVVALHTHADHLVTPEQESVHALAFAHMERAARLAYRPPDVALLDRPALVVDADRRVLDRNAAAEALLGAGDGLVAIRERIGAVDLAADNALQQAIVDVCRVVHTGVAARRCALPRPSGAPDLLLRLRPVPVRFAELETAIFRCAIDIVERAVLAEPLAPALLADLFGLTPREAQLASLLSGPCSDLPAAAAALGVGYGTARTHLRMVLDKCQVASQVALARLLATLR